MNYFGNKGGKGSSSSSSSTATEDPNTLLSRSTVRIIDVISEGPIVGLVNGFQSIYLDETPVQNSDGTFNYSGVSYDFRYGTPDQSYIAGFPSAENEVSLGVQVKNSLPVSSQITDEDADAVLIKIKVNSLTSVDKSNGNIHGTSVDIAFDVKTYTGSFVQVGTMNISGKTTSAYERSQRLELPEGGAPWTIRIRRLTADSDSSYLNNDTYVSTYTVLYDAKLKYPDTALIAYKIDAQQFGSSSPSRVTEVYGIISSVPSNYNPVTRVYSGLWDGTFKQAWHNNPVWVLWDIMTNNRYGLGDILKSSNIDKYGLYAISQYCDELVPDGFGGTEPRYTFNGVINSKTDAAAALDSIASVFRGMIYWGSGSVMFTHDAPKTATKLVTPANVINGEFVYSGSSLKSRHTSVLVTWNDPSDFGKSATEVVQRDELIQKFGYRETTVNAYGCTSRGQARRVGEWLLDTEANETEVVTYSASLDHADVRPGDLIAVADPAYAGGRYGGRIAAFTSNSITIDAPVDLIAGSTYQIAYVAENGNIETRTINNSAATGVTILTFATALTSNPIIGAMWVISGTEVNPRLFTVISNTEKANNIYEISALFHDPTKYARIEQDINLASPSYALELTGALKSPTNLTHQEFFKPVGNGSFPAVSYSWVIPTDARISGFEIQIQGPNDPSWNASSMSSTSSFDLYPTETGIYKIRIRSTALFLKPSAWVEQSWYLLGPKQVPVDILNFKISTVGPSSTLTWDVPTQSNGNIIDHYEIRYNKSLTLATWANSSILVESVPKNSTSTIVPARIGTYLIKAVSFAGVYSQNENVLTSEIAGNLDVNVIAILQENSDWLGVKDGTQVSSNELRLNNTLSTFMSDWLTLDNVLTIGGTYNLQGYYYFNNNLDLGVVSTASIDYTLNYYRLDVTNVLINWNTLEEVNSLDATTGDVNVALEFRTSNASLIWSEWESIKLGKNTFKEVQFRLNLTTNNNNVTPSITVADVAIDMDDRLANDYDVVCPSTGLRVTFSPAFIAPPSVHIDGQGLSSGDYHTVTLRDNTGFTIQFFNSSNVAKSATFDWIAKGYGYQQ